MATVAMRAAAGLTTTVEASGVSVATTPRAGEQGRRREEGGRLGPVGLRPGRQIALSLFFFFSVVQFPSVLFV